MAFPSIRSQIVTNGTTASATPAVNLPATVRQNDVLFVVFRVAVAGAIGWPTGWQELFDASPDAADDQMAAAWKRATGTESGTTITLSCTSGKFAAVAYAVQDSADPHIRAPELSTVATGTSTTPNATTVTPTGGAQDYLWLTFTGREGEATLPPTYPANYTVAQLTADSGTAGTVGTNVRVSGAVRTNNNAASEDAGAWTFSDSEDWTAYTIAFHPTPADATPALNKAWCPRVVRPALAAAACVLAFVPVIESAPAAADGVVAVADGQLYRAPTVQYTPIAGPVVAGSQLAWATPPPRPQASPPRIEGSVYAAPWTAATEAAVGWLVPPQPRSLPLPLVASVLAQPSSATDSAPQDVHWWPRFPDRTVHRIRFIAPYTADAPIAPSLPAAADAIAGLTGPQVWPRGVVQYTPIAGPVLVEAVVAVPDRPLTFNDDGVIRPDRVVQYTPVSGPIAIPLQTGYWTQPIRIVRERARLIQSLAVLPLRPPDVVADTIVPWPLSPPLVLARTLVRSVVAAPPSTTTGDRSDLPWLLVPNQPLRLVHPTRRSVLAQPIEPSDVPQFSSWLMPPLPLVLARLPIRSVLAAPPSTTTGALSDLPWLLVPAATLPRVLHPTRVWPVYALPWTSEIVIIPSTADVVILVQPDVGIIRVRPDVGIILVREDVGDVEV